jgi:hypothetical protein
MRSGVSRRRQAWARHQQPMSHQVCACGVLLQWVNEVPAAVGSCLWCIVCYTQQCAMRSSAGRGIWAAGGTAGCIQCAPWPPPGTQLSSAPWLLQAPGSVCRSISLLLCLCQGLDLGVSVSLWACVWVCACVVPPSDQWCAGNTCTLGVPVPFLHRCGGLWVLAALLLLGL